MTYDEGLPLTKSHPFDHAVTLSHVARYISTSTKLLSIQHGMGHPLTKSFWSYTYRMLRDKLKTLYLQFYMFCKNQIWCSSDLE